jgi:D-alanyl-D-alanine carboxypeptidase (penicillin-binding protein 5/6)
MSYFLCNLSLPESTNFRKKDDEFVNVEDLPLKARFLIAVSLLASSVSCAFADESAIPSVTPPPFRPVHGY